MDHWKFGKVEFVLVRKSESGHRPVGPASQDNLTNITENDELHQLVTEVALLLKEEMMIKEVLAIMHENKNNTSPFLIISA